MKKFIVTMTCFNRREKTLQCLERLFLAAGKVSDITLHVIIVDDGSTDGTSDAIRVAFGDRVKIVAGTGSLFWGGGMRLAMETALTMTFDYLVWLNDDTMLSENALISLDEGIKSYPEAILVGATHSSVDKEICTYGGVVRKSKMGRTNWSRHPISNVFLQSETMNGNFVSIPHAVVNQLGSISKQFTHSLGDFDYGLRARRIGVEIVQVPGSVGCCDRNPIAGSYQDKSLSKSVRWSKLCSLKGFPPYEWAVFTYRHAGPLWFLYWAWPYAKFITKG